MKKSKRLRNHATVLKFSAWSYALLAFLYPVFTLSSYQVEDPSNVAAFLEGIVTSAGAGHVWWLLFTMIPLLLIFGAVGFYSAVKPYSYKLSGLALIFSILSSIGFVLGIGRWSTINWGFGEAFVKYKENSEILTKLYLLSNELMGFWFGHALAELCLFISIGFMSFVMFKSKRFPKWLCGFSSVIFILGTISVFRGMNNMADTIHIFLNSFMLLPLFFLLLAIALYRFKGRPVEKPLARQKKKLKKKSKKAKKSKRK